MLAQFQEMMMSFAESIMKVLPTSPFQDTINNIANLPYLGILNWFIPVKGIVAVGASWLTAIGLFYLYSIIMRWVKMIGD